jgi:hypothetical protein
VGSVTGGLSQLAERILAASLFDKRGAGLDPKGYDAGKKVTGRKRYILVDALGLLLGVRVLLANIQDRDDARDPVRGGVFNSTSGSSPMEDLRGRKWP